MIDEVYLAAYKNKNLRRRRPPVRFFQPWRLRVLCISRGLITSRGRNRHYAERTTCLRCRHAILDAQIAHRRHCWTADFPHWTGPGWRTHVRAQSEVSQTLCRNGCDRNRSASSRDTRANSRLRTQEFHGREKRTASARVVPDL